MKNVRIIYTPKRPCGADPLAIKNTIAVKGEIEGEKYGFFLELEDEDSTVEKVVQVIQGMVGELEKIRDMVKENQDESQEN